MRQAHIVESHGPRWTPVLEKAVHTGKPPSPRSQKAFVNTGGKDSLLLTQKDYNLHVFVNIRNKPLYL